jgi:hypothetical protein
MVKPDTYSVAGRVIRLCRVLFVVCGLIVIGIAYTFFARRIQHYYIRSYERWPPMFKWYPPRKYIESPFFVWQLRLLGILILGAGLYFLFDLIGFFLRVGPVCVRSIWA